MRPCLRRTATRIALPSLLVSVAAGIPCSAQSEPILVVFRCDDYCADVPGERYAGEWAAWQEIIELFRANGLRLNVAVIPRVAPDDDPSSAEHPLASSPDRVAYLRAAIADGTVEPCLHGYAHRYTHTWRGQPSELAGLSPERQVEMIRLGKQELEAALGQPVRIFVPPNNQYDRATTEALIAADIPILSALMTVPPGAPALTYVPVTTRYYEFPDALRAAEASPGPSLIVVGFHPFEIRGVHPRLLGSRELIAMDDLAATLERLAAHPRVRVVTIEQVARDWPQFTSARYLRLQRTVYAVWPTPYLGKLAALVGGRSSGRVLWPQHVYYRLLPLKFLPALLGLLVGLGLGRLALRPSARRWAQHGSAAVACLGAVGGAVWIGAGLRSTWAGELFAPKQQAAVWFVVGLMLATWRVAKRRRQAP